MIVLMICLKSWEYEKITEEEKRNEAILKVKEKYWEFANKRDTYLLIGTQYKWQNRNAPDPYVIIGVFSEPKHRELSLFEDDLHEIKRKYFVWGSNDGKWRTLETISNAHIEAILETQYQIRGTHIYRLFMDELVYRADHAIFVKEYRLS